MTRTLNALLLVLPVLCVGRQAEAQSRPSSSQSLELLAMELACDPAAQREVELDDDQIEQLRILGGEFRAAIEDLLSLDGDAGASREVRAGYLRGESWERYAAARNENMRKVTQVLDPDELQRLKELALQQLTEGSVQSLFRLEEFTMAAAVTEEQQEASQALNLEMFREMARQGGDREERSAWWRGEGMRKYASRYEALLTEEQKEILADMRGADFDVAQLMTPEERQRAQTEER